MMQLALDQHGKPGFMSLTLAAMRNMGLETYESTFLQDRDRKAISPIWEKILETVIRPFAWLNQSRDGPPVGKQPGAPPRACNVAHAILRSRRGEGKEAIVIVTPLWYSSQGEISILSRALKLLKAGPL